MSTIRADVVQNAAGGATTLTGLYPARAWINQTNGNTINASGNISGIVDNGVGRYTANLGNAIPTANAVVFGTRVNNEVNEDRQGIACGPITTSSFQFGGGHNHDLGAYEDGTYSAGIMC